MSAVWNSTSGPILITWGLPTAGGPEVTGYRIYSTIGGMVNNNFTASTDLQYLLDLNGVQLEDAMVSIAIRTESAQLPSDLVTVPLMITTVEVSSPVSS